MRKGMGAATVGIRKVTSAQGQVEQATQVHSKRGNGSGKTHIRMQ